MGEYEVNDKKFPYSWFKFVDDHTIFYAGLNFASRNLLDSIMGGTFMEITFGESTKILDNIMANYSRWHTERSSTSKKVHAIEEINTLSGKMDELMKLIASKSAPIDPNDMSLSTFIENNKESMDVNFFGRNNFGNNVYRGYFNPRLFPSNYGNSYNNSYGNYNNMPSNFESNIKEFISSQRVSML